MNLQSLEFEAVFSQIASFCACDLSRTALRSDLTFSSDYDVVTSRLALVDEMMSIIRDTSDALPSAEISDLRPLFADTRAEGTFIDIVGLNDLRKNLVTLHSLIIFISSADPERFPNLSKTIDGSIQFQDVIKRIDSIIDRYGNVRDNASPTLLTIRRSMQEAQGSVVRTLNGILKEAKSHGLVDPDVAPTMREGRLMLPIPTANKRQIHGIVHDESATGKTAFIEPAAVVEINNRLRELEAEERREIIRILIDFTSWLRPYYETILGSMHCVARIDALHARAKYSISISATIPNITRNLVEIYQARHPLLQQSLRNQGREIVPLDIKLTRKQRILIISGPNAGGKSVCLKTLGLLQYMLGCGLPIPVAERSSTMLFSSILVDIGDEQSIENDLSTYSSHLLNMKNFLRQANGRTLLLIDEFGSGTEPLIGGAIAEAILAQLNERQTYGVITTHYSNLKNFASHTEGLVNGAMLYDRHNMQPLFALSIGMAGSSFAIDIARKIGLPKSVIDTATSLVGEEQVDFDKYLQDVARDKRYWEKKREQIHEQEKRIHQLETKYNTQLAEIRKEEKRIIADARSEAAELISNANAEIEKTIRDIKENNAERIATREARRQLREQTERLREANVEAKKQERTCRIGDTVRIEDQQMIGNVVDVQGRQAVVLFGQIKTTVNMSRLVPATQSKQAIVKKSNVVDLIHDHQTEFNPEIDIRGMRVDEALQTIIEFIDDAVVLRANNLRILHGTGTGALRQLVRDYLQNLSTVQNFHDEHPQLGGAGITVIELKRQ